MDSRLAPSARIGTANYHASILTIKPLNPLLARSISAVPPVCRASAELVGIPDEVWVEDGPVELLVPLDEEPVAEFDELEELEVLEKLEEGLVGAKVSCPAPKPMAAASVPLPPTVTELVASLLAITRSPLLLSQAATFAWPATFALMALIRSPTVSVPVEVYVVVRVPSLTVTVPFARIPRVNSEVLVVSGAVPVPVAGEPKGLELEEEEEPVEPLDVEEVKPLELLELSEPGCSTFCMAAVNSVLTRFRAVWLAMLDKPLDSVVMALAMTLIRAALRAADWVALALRLQ